MLHPKEWIDICAVQEHKYIVIEIRIVFSGDGLIVAFCNIGTILYLVLGGGYKVLYIYTHTYIHKTLMSIKLCVSI